LNDHGIFLDVGGTEKKKVVRNYTHAQIIY
jgi:hypothetical protein